MKLHDYIGQPWDPTFYWDQLYAIDSHGKYCLPTGSRNEDIRKQTLRTLASTRVPSNSNPITQHLRDHDQAQMPSERTDR